MTTRKPIPCRSCGESKGRKHEGDFSMCAACGQDRYRYRMTPELSSAIDAVHAGTGTADDVATASFNQAFADIEAANK